MRILRSFHDRGFADRCGDFQNRQQYKFFFACICLILITSFFMAPLLGCAQKESSEPGVVEYMVGAEQLKAYKRAESELKEVDSTLEKRYREMEE